MKFDLRIIRALLDISSETFANELGVSRQTINNWEKGKVKLTKFHKMAIAYLIEHKYCDIPIERMKLIQEMLNDL